MSQSEAIELMIPDKQKTENSEMRKKQLVRKMWMTRYVAIVAGPQGRRKQPRMLPAMQIVEEPVGDSRVQKKLTAKPAVPSDNFVGEGEEPGPQGWVMTSRMPPAMQFVEEPEGASHIQKKLTTTPAVPSETCVDGEYEQQYTCWPPPLAMILISLVQVVVHVCVEMTGGTLLTNPLSRVLLYSPFQRRQAWRFLSYMFVHDGWTHLLVNVAVQVLLALPLEMVHRWWRLLVLYLAGVALGSLGVSLVDPNNYLVGASGGTYAVITAHLANITLNWAEMDYACAQLIIFLLLVVPDVSRAIYLRYIQNIITKVSYAAHFFGALSGLLFGIIILRNIEIHRWEKIVKKMCIILFVSISLLAILVNIFFPEYFPPEK